MNYLSEWQAIAGRINGLVEATRLFFQSGLKPSYDSYSTGGYFLLPQAENIFRDLGNYYSSNKDVLPNNAARSLENFITKHASRFAAKYQDLDIRSMVLFRIIGLASFKAEFSYLLSDTAAVAKRLSERAFQHLQRSIVADPEIKKKWANAFEEGEVECERLGAVHLLLHGIWAFKVTAAGEATDLVFPEPTPDISEIERCADAVVLTEWKKAQTDSEVLSKIQKAKEQTSRYKGGALGGLELANYRYIVIVTKKHVKMRPDEKDGEITYRHINIAVNPDYPSQ
jgi:hypothetical protein